MMAKSLTVAFLALSLCAAALAQTETPTEPAVAESASDVTTEGLSGERLQSGDTVPLPVEPISNDDSVPVSSATSQAPTEEELRRGEQLMWAFLLTPLVLIALIATGCVAVANHAWQKYQYRVFWNGLNFLVAAGLLTAWMFVGLYGWGSYLLVVPAMFLLIPLWNAVRRTGWKTGILVWIAQIVGLPLVIFAVMMVRGSMNARHA